MGPAGRYYFLNNVNVWLWGLYGNEEPSVWDVVQTNRKIPEIGGRLQLPVPKGEMGLTYHHRTADSRQLGELLERHQWSTYNKKPEDRLGLDGKWDVLLGLWFEASWTHKAKDLDILANQYLFNVGADYTFGLGNGLNMVLEHLVISQDVKSFEMDAPINRLLNTLKHSKMIAFKLAFRNLLGAGLRTWLIVAVLSFAYVVILFYIGMLSGWDRQGRRDTKEWEIGQGQLWHSAYDKYDLFSIQVANGLVDGEARKLTNERKLTPLIIVQGTA